ncbi:hypothetical protein [Eudoraea adriatica]|uniref:hypothetical protein n=1 Tax=Eudoraea adriatica TaxID=446681 RepID=UPI0012F71740|nr:hypothetical protein [Eudoraea adriatica]
MLFTSLAIYNQVDNGSYTSNKTSYQDEINGANNFMELTRNNIFIDVSRDGKKGVFVFQDPRIPEKILSYGVISSEVYQSEQQTIYIYNCEVLHLPDQPETDIIIYWNKQGGMNIMVKDEYSSQVFHSLKWVE